jgi:hypothetical protein
MGRLAFLKRTLPALLAQPAHVCLVDYSCPEACGAWLESQHGAEVDAGRALVVRVPGRAFFHKTEALNLGARAAVAAGAGQLCFADADTLLAPGAVQHLRAALQPGLFVVAGRGPGGASIPSLTGLLAVGAGDFTRAGGYDEGFEDWGSEDIELRLRLHLRAGLRPAFAAPWVAAPIAHGNWLRTRFHRERDIRRSAGRNFARLATLVQQWTGRPLEEAPEIVQTLLFEPARSANRAIVRGR